MWVNGDQARIREVGFSLLDMKRYLQANGFAADGFKVPLAKLQEAQIPAIALIVHRGYSHFVVIKGITDSEVLLADPAAGLRSMDREEFEALRDPVLLVVRSHLEIGQRHFQGDGDWGVRLRPRDRASLETRDLGMSSLMLPGLNEF